MSAKARLTGRRGLAHEDLDAWPTPEREAISKEKLEGYDRNVRAVRLYQKQSSLEQIQAQTGLAKVALYRLVDRCLELDARNVVRGFHACVPYSQGTQEHDLDKLESDKPKPGSLSALFLKFPGLEEALKAFAQKGERYDRKTPEKLINEHTTYEYFKKLCAREGIVKPHYPFNVESRSLGKISIRRWLHKVRAESLANPSRIAGLSLALPFPKKIFEAVEGDGHRIDYRCEINVGDPETGAEHWVQVDRFWIITIVEVVSRAILGYAISLSGGPNYAAYDLTRAIKSCMVPWKPRALSIKGLSYKKGDGLPSGVVPGCAYACFDELRMDNAKAHLSDFAIGEIERWIHAQIVFGPVATPNSRPFIEGFHKIIELAGIHRIPGTVGSSPKDCKKLGGKDRALPRLEYRELEDLCDLLVARICSQPVSTYGLSPNDLLAKHLSAKHHIVRHVPVELRGAIDQYDMYVEATISQDKGGVLVRFAGARYYGEGLTSELLRRKVYIKANSQDLRYIECSLAGSGVSLGRMIVEARWRSTKHSWATRREIKELERSGWVPKFHDIVEAYQDHISGLAKRSTKAAAKLARLRKEQGDGATSAQSSSDTKDSEYSEDRYRSSDDLSKSDEMEYELVRTRLAGVGPTFRK